MTHTTFAFPPDEGFNRVISSLNNIIGQADKRHYHAPANGDPLLASYKKYITQLHSGYSFSAHEQALLEKKFARFANKLS